MVKSVKRRILNEYEKKCSHYSTFTEKIEKLIRDLIRENNLRVHSVTSRVKTGTSLEMKLLRAEEVYSKLSDVPDISGLRIITFFADDVDLLANMIEKEFDVEKNQSVDKRKLLDPDRFGYLSLHYVVKLPDSRLKLTEYRRFADCHTEIQIRSILQHAWAEIEHDLGYKSKQAVPKSIRRCFSRLAGLLEIADDEFIQIRNNLFEYEKNVPKLITKAPEEVLIDKASLVSFIKKSPLVHVLDQEIASRTELEIGAFTSNIVGLLQELEYIGVKTVAELQVLLSDKREIIIRFAELWNSLFPLSPGEPKSIGKGICIFYLGYILVGEKQSVTEALNYLKSAGIGPDYEQKSIAEDIVSTYTKARSR